MKKIQQNWRSHLSTFMGAIVAIALAWQCMGIDWDNFEFTPQNCIKLFIAAMVAVGGYCTKVKGGKSLNDKSNHGTTS